MDKIIFGPQNDFYVNFAKEDGPIEFLTAVFYFLSFLFSILMGLRFIKQKKKFFAFFYLFLSVTFFLIAFEEISWGQRIFLIETPEILIDNDQGELNLHNLSIFHDFKRFSILLVGILGFTLWAFFTQSDKLKDKPFTKFCIPQGFTMFYFISVIIWFQLDFLQIDKLSEELDLFFFTWPDDEIFEFILSMGIFIFITSKFFELKNQKRTSKLQR